MADPRRASRWDFADPASMLLLRSRVLGWYLVTSALTGEVARWLAPGLWARVLPFPWYAIVVPLLVAGVWVLHRGSRLTEAGFVAVIVGADWLAAAGIVDFSSGGMALSFEALGLPFAAMAGVFCGTRRGAVVGTAAVVAGTGVCTVVRLAPEGTWPPGLVISCVGLLFVSIVVRLLREIAGAAIAQARIGEVTDPLTGLANRRGLERSGTAVWQAAAAARQTLAVLVVDIDHFKRVNDSLGHAAGDELIRRVAGVLTAAAGDGDLAVRLGGEEFALLARTTDGGPRALAERLRIAVEREAGGATVSVGGHEVTPTPKDALPDAIWTAVDLADRALYEAKRTGRNRSVCVADLPRQATARSVSG